MKYAKSDRKRNFENGIVTDDPALNTPLEDQFDAVWRGDFCKGCGRKDWKGSSIPNSSGLKRSDVMKVTPGARWTSVAVRS